ncbi:beta-N-acetylhexosaminidase [Fictibacillus sp. KU28468]|uniref:beta-N-acetylhexosaminidase n=1 Tax=Fictibacillus sp. KU28468 TaxID=2991053 RepID=UPI00223E47CB|nr:beta-N-acetylhexosaminidase [Fictibacillus sp. KU28468]UZJ80944.1 beta-N-acetylhexosaminidase [Fictibacillus sp. KU28468]
MKVSFLGELETLQEGIEKIAPLLGIEICEDGLPIHVVKSSNSHLDVQLENGQGLIGYHDKIHFFRAMGLFVEATREKETFHITEQPYFDMNGAMFDCSRNAVMKTETAKTFLRYMAIMGLNVMMLYTEDTYTIDGDPYFGYMRGRYSNEELQEIDDYAYSLGIEVIPCIQTLAHLSTYLKWSHTSAIRDTEDVLLVGNQNTYEFIEKMIVSASSPFRSKRIHIGMDEAHGLGRGNYLDQQGKKNRYSLMTQHLKLVEEILKKYKLRPMIWSDMYFRVWSEADAYYDLNIEIPEEETKQVSKQVQMVYWDYYNEEEGFYEQYIDKHAAFGSLPIFAGGIWTWHGPTIHYEKTFHTSNPALAVCKRKGVREVFATLWGDNGAESNFFFALLGLQLFAEHGYNSIVDEHKLKKRFEFCTGGNYEAFLTMGKLDVHPQANIHALIPDSPAKYLLWQDILLGLFDKNIEGLGFSQHFQNIKDELQRYLGTSSPWKSLYSFMMKLCTVLSIKSELGLKISEFYHGNRKEELKEIAIKELNLLEEAVKDLRMIHRRQWFSNNKPFGWEILDIRYGGLLARIETVRDRLMSFIDGRIDTLDEMEEEKLFYDSFSRDSKKGVGKEIKYQRIVSANPL